MRRKITKSQGLPACPELYCDCQHSRNFSGVHGFSTLGTRGFSRVQREFSVLAERLHIFGPRPNSLSVLAEGRHIFGRRRNSQIRKVSGTQGTVFLSLIVSLFWETMKT